MNHSKGFGKWFGCGLSTLVLILQLGCASQYVKESKKLVRDIEDNWPKPTLLVFETERSRSPISETHDQELRNVLKNFHVVNVKLEREFSLTDFNNDNVVDKKKEKKKSSQVPKVDELVDRGFSQRDSTLIHRFNITSTPEIQMHWPDGRVARFTPKIPGKVISLLQQIGRHEEVGTLKTAELEYFPTAFKQFSIDEFNR